MQSRSFVLQEYNKHCKVESSFQLDPSQVKSFSFSFPASQSSVRDTIEVSILGLTYPTIFTVDCYIVYMGTVTLSI